jgi:hypothetical protein
MPDSIFEPKNPEGSTPKEAPQKEKNFDNFKEVHAAKIKAKKIQKEADELAAEKEAIKKIVEQEEAKIRNATDGARVFYSKYRGLKIGIIPKDRQWDKELKKNVVIEGKHIKFNDCVYVTKDEAEIKFLENYAKMHPREVFFQNPKQEKLLKALAMVEAEEKAQRGKQGAISGG